MQPLIKSDTAYGNTYICCMMYECRYKKDRNLKKCTVLLCQVSVTQKNTSLFCFFFSFENSFTVSVCFECIPGLTGCFKIIFVHQLCIFLVDFKVIIFRKCDPPLSRISKKVALITNKFWITLITLNLHLLVNGAAVTKI
jgi:hypothetical protein